MYSEKNCSVMLSYTYRPLHVWKAFKIYSFENTKRPIDNGLDLLHLLVIGFNKMLCFIL